MKRNEFDEKLKDVLDEVHTDLKRWGKLKREGILHIEERIPSQSTSFEEISKNSSSDGGDRITKLIIEEQHEIQLCKNYDKYISYLSYSEINIIKDYFYNNISINQICRNRIRSRYYIKNILEQALYKLAYQNPRINFLDIDYDMYQLNRYKNKITSWKKSFIKSLEFDRKFYKERINLLPDVMKERLYRRINHDVLSTYDRTIVDMAVYFLAYTLPKSHPLHIDKKTLIDNYKKNFTRSDLLNNFLKNYEVGYLKLNEIPIQAIFTNNKKEKFLFYFNNNEEYQQFISKNPNLKYLYSQSYVNKEF